jgi:hypothetical protein
MSSIEQRLYSKISSAMALQRCGATQFLKPSRMITIDGTHTHTMDKKGIFPSYSIQDLLVNPFKSGIEFDLSGDIQNDIRHAVKLICVYMLSRNPNPFRVWCIDHYMNDKNMKIFLEPNGRLVAYKVSQTDGVIIRNDDHNLQKSMVIEKFCGRVDANFVPIMENDIVVDDNHRMAKVVQDMETWMLVNIDPKYNFNRSLCDNESVIVVGSARNNKETLLTLSQTITEDC